MSEKMLYKIKEEKHNEKDLKKIISDYPEIKFVYSDGLEQGSKVLDLINKISKGEIK